MTVILAVFGTAAVLGALYALTIRSARRAARRDAEKELAAGLASHRAQVAGEIARAIEQDPDCASILQSRHDADTARRIGGGS